MSEIPEKKENFETNYSDYFPTGNSTMFGSESNDTIAFVGSNLPGGMGDDHIRINNYWEDDGFSLTGNPYASPDVFNFGGPAAAVTFGNNYSTTFTSQSFNLNKKTQDINLTTSEKINNDHFWKFGEGETLKAVNDYIVSTYNAHYASEKSKVQVLDMIDAIGDGVPFCRDNLIKYSSRFGKKDGMSRLDALKIIHYGILLYHFAGFNNQTKNNNETF
jgi:hypothetical protein